MPTPILQQFKVTALPSTLVANAIYYVAGVSDTLLNIYVVDNAGVATKHTINASDVNLMVAAAMSAISQLTIVNNITDRDALVFTTPNWVYVKDAALDTSVVSGGATYLYNPTDSSWIKTSEAESLDVVLSWANIENKPASSTSAIDAAVNATHTHPNLSALNEITLPLKSPVFGYNGIKLSTVTYSDGSVKTFTYTNDLLTQVDLTRNSVTTRKVFTYSGDTLINIVDSVL